MAIANDWYVDYQNQLTVHATYTFTYDAGLGQTFRAGQTIGNLASPTKTAIIVAATNGVTGTLDVVYVNGAWADNDELYVGSTHYATVNGDPAAKTTVYTTRALYSFIQDTFDELVQMDDTVPMSAQTPTEFTMINGWFIDDESTKYLSGGALASSGYTGVIQVLTLSSGGYTPAINTDIGKVVKDDGGNTGALLAFNNTTRKWWVRWGTQIASSSAMTITSGTGVGTAASNSATGEDLFSNIYTLGSITTDPNPKSYIFQNSNAIRPEWWGRGDAQSHIDVLIKVKEVENLIDSGNITVFVRHFGDLYDHFPITVATGGRNAVPLATSTDINNNTTGEITIAYSALTGGTFTVGQFVRDNTSGAYGEVFADTGSILTIGNVILGSGDFGSAHTIYKSTDGITNGTVYATSGTITSVVRGYNDIKIYFVNLSLPYTSGGPTTPTIGATFNDASSGASAIIIGYTTTGGTWAGSDAAGTLTLANWNGTAYVNSNSINQANPTVSDICTAGTQSVTSTYNEAFTQGTAYPYNVIVNCASRTMAQVYEWFKYVTREQANSTQTNYQTMYRVSGVSVIQEDGEEYIAAQSTYSPVKASPFGTLAGGKLFAARGVWVENMATGDRQNFQLIDANGNNRVPPNFINITVTSVVSGDKVSIFRTSSGTTINKTQFASASGNTSGNATFIVSGSIPSDTPNSGYIRVVDTSDTSINRESRYAYISWTASTFTLSGSVTLDRTYSAGDDTAYVPYYDEIAGNTSVTVTVIYNSDQSVLTRTRRYNGASDSILPFQITGSVGSTGYTVAAIRTADTIVT